MTDPVQNQHTIIAHMRKCIPRCACSDDFYTISEMIMWKRKEKSFKDSLGLVKYMAILDNKLQGQIPSGISCVRGLNSLDLARNNLTGSIPPKIGQLKSLEFLDLVMRPSRGIASAEKNRMMVAICFQGCI